MPKSQVRKRVIAEKSGTIPAAVQDRLNRWREKSRGTRVIFSRPSHIVRSLDLPREVFAAQLVGEEGADFVKRAPLVRRSLVDDTLVPAALPDDDAIDNMRRRMREARL